MKRLIWLLAVIVMVGVTAGVANAREPKAPPGYVVASFWERAGIPQTLTVTQVDSRKKYYVAVGPLGSNTAPDELGIASAVAVKKLPPGRYFASSIQITSGGLSGALDFGYAFTVESGKATYIGEYRPFLIWGKWFGASMPTSAKCSVSDKLDRDRPIAAKKLPPGIPLLDQAPARPTPLEDLQ